MTAEGVVYFTYGDDRCKYPVITIYYTNNCLITTNPSWKECGDDNQRTVFLYFKEKGETFNVSALCIGGWNVYSPTLKYFVNDNNIFIISNENDDSLFIRPNNECGGRNVEVKLIKKP